MCAVLRQRDVDVDALDSHDGKGPSDADDRSEWLKCRFQWSGGEPVDLQVEILLIVTEQAIPYPASNDERTTARSCDSAHHLEDLTSFRQA